MAASGAVRGARYLAERIRAEKRATGGRETPPLHAALRELRSWVVRQDSELVLINKPSGLSTHGGPSVQHSVTSLLPALSEMLFGRGAEPLRACHRLDKDTSGALILARSAEAAERIQRLMRERRVQRVYW
ncbi:mitochondrial RNA pseudouridine synthase RPUSD4 isoform X2 [Bufo bufo]|uniref:mitochondrial RNA pseudouridine synthase RPUSD4 isoform X2 n=1 Tax=Bufo bufo TaxID=8384 RepID=UPI001ABEA813|nr:mitochondrial RNA pseudouridine synthase RPUSD4 isoform X2 [Bufo bufo]